MLTIDIKFKLREIDFEFKAQIKRGESHTFKVDEESLADKLFWILCGLDTKYEGKIEGEGVSWGASTWNNVLALGDTSMFISGTARRNIYKAIRVRADRKTAKQRTEEVIRLYGLEVLAGLKTKYLSDEELLRVAIARAHFRKIGLVIVKGKDFCEIDCSTHNEEQRFLLENCYAKWPDAYILKVT